MRILHLKKWLFVLGATIVILLGLKVVFNELVIQKLLQNSRQVSITPLDKGLEFESGYAVGTSGNSVHYWWVPAQRDEAISQSSVLIFHGQGETIDNWLGAIDEFVQNQFNVMIFDYSGYGMSDPTDDIRSWSTDVAAIASEFSNRAQGSQFVIGFSLGGAVLLDNLEVMPPKVCSMAIVSTFASLKKMVIEKYAVLEYLRFLLPDDYYSVGKVGELSVPTMLLHVSGDEVVSEQHYHALSAAGQKSLHPVLLKGMFKHNDFWQSPKSAPLQEVISWFSENRCDDMRA
ncbi:alpha/beta hydrolase [Vibrio parahaemolyticus]|uniref:alpha/beta hydrolase n=1 Tax=Vibrio parahaemolyticus TaxID=670 RepID=UPI001D87EB07|nr:alpha/beta fold hydrolase [Vibrio parahaemolyticus]EGR2301709.1 alpha/beta fold hydrolase [Vibrio parahaemolyticus]UYW18586.1 alpha/beta fold hydrolase [Vibrio parahaemolyticus]